VQFHILDEAAAEALTVAESEFSARGGAPLAPAGNR